MLTIHRESASEISKHLKKPTGCTLMIVGQNGIGKTTLVSNLIKESDFIVHMYDSITYKNDNLYEGMIHMNKNGIAGQFNTELTTL